MSIEAQLLNCMNMRVEKILKFLRNFKSRKAQRNRVVNLFNEMMARIDSMDGVGILAWHPDRLARNSVDGGRIIYAVDTTKIVSLRFPTFWFEPTPQGQIHVAGGVRTE